MTRADLATQGRADAGGKSTNKREVASQLKNIITKMPGSRRQTGAGRESGRLFSKSRADLGRLVCPRQTKKEGRNFKFLTRFSLEQFQEKSEAQTEALRKTTNHSRVELFRRRTCHRSTAGQLLHPPTQTFPTACDCPRRPSAHRRHPRRQKFDHLCPSDTAVR